MKLKTDIHGLTVEAPKVKDAWELFSVVNSNRKFLRQWLPWLDINVTWRDSQTFLRSAKLQNQSNKALIGLLKWRGQIIGVVGFNEILIKEKTGLIGYWLAQDWNGRGFISAALRAVMAYSSMRWGLELYVIRAAVGNDRSRAVAERLGFKFERINRKAENLYGVWHDHAVYELVRVLKRENI